MRFNKSDSFFVTSKPLKHHLVVEKMQSSVPTQ